MSRRLRIHSDIDVERDRQDRKFGPQTHSDGTSDDDLAVMLCNIHRDACEAATEAGKLTWKLILEEEIFEAFAEVDPAKLREELIQCAAVIVNWVEDMDGKRAAIPGTFQNLPFPEDVDFTPNRWNGELPTAEATNG